jgi:hypothetical protein
MKLEKVGYLIKKIQFKPDYSGISIQKYAIEFVRFIFNDY